MQVTLGRLATAEQASLQTHLMNVVATALWYNPSLALQALQQQGQLQTVFSRWLQVSASADASAAIASSYRNSLYTPKG